MAAMNSVAVRALACSLLITACAPRQVCAAAAVARQQQRKAAAEQAQVEAYKQALAQKQAEEVQAYEQAKAQAASQQQAQAYQQAQIQAYQQTQAQAVQQAQIQAAQQAQIQAYQQAQVQAQAEIQAIAQAQGQVYQQTQIQAYQQTHAYQQAQAQAVAQAQLSAAQKSVQVQTKIIMQEALAAKQQEESSRALLKAAQLKNQDALEQQAALHMVAAKQQYETEVARQLGQQLIAGLDKPFEQVPASEVKDVVDISQVYKSMEKDSRAWALLIDNQAKVMTVSEFIARIRQQGERINKSPLSYVHLIDGMVQQNPQMLQKPFMDLLQIVAVVEYDLDNGKDKDLMARQVLGDQGWLVNKKRLGR